MLRFFFFFFWVLFPVGTDTPLVYRISRKPTKAAIVMISVRSILVRRLSSRHGKDWARKDATTSFIIHHREENILANVI